MLIDDGKGLGLLDFQDALAGHPAYDLVSLLQDARRDVAPDIEAAMRTRYAQATGAGNDFAAAYAVLGAQRNAKIPGIFTRLWKRDGRPDESRVGKECDLTCRTRWPQYHKKNNYKSIDTIAHIIDIRH